jgi:hypothetical protein
VTLQESVRQPGEQLLSSPVGLGLGPEGWLWIADTGNHRVLGLSPDRSAIRKLSRFRRTSAVPVLPRPPSSRRLSQSISPTCGTGFQPVIPLPVIRRKQL